MDPEVASLGYKKKAEMIQRFYILWNVDLNLCIINHYSDMLGLDNGYGEMLVRIQSDSANI